MIDIIHLYIYFLPYHIYIYSAQGGLSSQFPLLYGLMNAQGFVSPYVLKDGRCTFCTENPLTNNAVDELVDHIYITTDTIDRVVHAMVSVCISQACMHVYVMVI